MDGPSVAGEEGVVREEGTRSVRREERGREDGGR